MKTSTPPQEKHGRPQKQSGWKGKRSEGKKKIRKIYGKKRQPEGKTFHTHGKRDKEGTKTTWRGVQRPTVGGGVGNEREVVRKGKGQR